MEKWFGAIGGGWRAKTSPPQTVWADFARRMQRQRRQKGLIYVTGDTHGDLRRFQERAVRRLKRQDTLIVLGDFGFLWDDSKEEQKALKWLTKRHYQLLFIDGCHENFDLLRDYPLVDYKGGRARHLGGNLYYILRGSILQVEGKRLLCFGGGESEDKDEREEGLNWWRAEMPTTDELERCAENLAAADKKVDYILTHDAPARLLAFTAMEREQTNWLHAFFDQLLLSVDYRSWMFGRYHRDLPLSSKARAVFCDLVPLE